MTSALSIEDKPIETLFFFLLILHTFAVDFNWMARILSIDYGRKRVGIAVTDPGQIIANRLTTVPTHAIWDFLKTYFGNEEVETLVVGYPRQMNNEASGIKLELYDERFTSKLALQTMIDGGLKRKQRQDKAIVDAVSATIILQGYLEQKRNSKQ